MAKATYRAAAEHANRVVLTNRQREILLLVAEGFTNKQIGARLEISADTVKHHTVEIINRFGAANRASAVARALRAGVIA